MSLVLTAHWRDLPQLAVLERQAYPEDAWSQNTWWAELASPRRRYLVAVEKADRRPPGRREVLGYAGLDAAGATADLMTLTVSKQHRGRKIGGRLLSVVGEFAQCEGAGALLLEVRADNQPALGLYRRAGFEAVGTRPGYYRSAAGPIDAIVMRKLLSVGETSPSDSASYPHTPKTQQCPDAEPDLQESL